MHLIIAVTGSLFIHAAFLLILSLSWLHAPLPPKKGTTETIRVELIETKQPSTHPPANTTVDKHGKKVYKRDEVICSGKDNTYIGVGIMIQPGSDTVTSAPEQYPAYIAGMRVGDFIIDPFFSNIVDGYIDFDVRRGTDILKFHIKVDNICYKTLD